MENIFEETVELVRQGAKFKVDFVSRSLKVDRRMIIENGQFEGSSGLQDLPTDNVLECIEDYYHQYKNSIPSERSESKRFRYFKALPEHELNDMDMLYGFSRDEAQITLELYILLCIIEKKLVWDEETMGKWFWQSKADKDLVILRSWVETKNNN